MFRRVWLEELLKHLIAVVVTLITVTIIVVITIISLYLASFLFSIIITIIQFYTQTHPIQFTLFTFTLQIILIRLCSSSWNNIALLDLLLIIFALVLLINSIHIYSLDIICKLRLDNNVLTLTIIIIIEIMNLISTSISGPNMLRWYRAYMFLKLLIFLQQLLIQLHIPTHQLLQVLDLILRNEWWLWILLRVVDEKWLLLLLLLL